MLDTGDRFVRDVLSNYTSQRTTRRRSGGELAEVSPHLAWARVGLVGDLVTPSATLSEEIPEQDHEQGLSSEQPAEVHDPRSVRIRSPGVDSQLLSASTQRGSLRVFISSVLLILGRVRAEMGRIVPWSAPPGTCSDVPVRTTLRGSEKRWQ